jgi:hypothetical protein
MIAESSNIDPCKHCETLKKRFKESRERRCAACGTFDPLCNYMVTNAAWKAAGFRAKDVACWSCFVVRLGREVRLEDVPSYPINNTLIWALSRILPDAKES